MDKKMKDEIDKCDWLVSNPNEFKKMSDEELIRHQLAGFIPTYKRAELPEWYDFIMENKEYATKEELIFLLEKMDRPKKATNEDKINTLLGIKISLRALSKAPKGQKPMSKRKIIKMWYDIIEPKNKYEEKLKELDFIEAYNRIHRDLQTHFPDKSST